MSITKPSAWVGLCVLASCSHPQRPYSFRQDIAVDQATTLIADSLDADGHPAAVVVPRSGMVVTQWLDTGYRLNEEIKDDFHPPQPLIVEKRIYRRYRVDVVAGHPNEFRVQAEAKRCLPEVVVRDQRLLGQCDDMAVFFPALQNDLDAFGARLERLTKMHVSSPAGGGPSLAQRP